MELDRVMAAQIHPAIGVARVGDSDEYFIGPEVPAGAPRPPGGYKDAQGRLRREAARFRLFGYDEHGKFVGELNAGADIEIIWHVHVANKKAAWYDFLFPLDVFEQASANWSAQAAPRRNPQVCGEDRRHLVIDAGRQSIPATSEARLALDRGSFFDTRVPLGEIETDGRGRLVFLAGHGRSGSIYEAVTPTSFANNAGWYDDIADGPIEASVRVSGREIPVDGAWVVTAPPNYAPGIPPAQTLYDVIYDAYVGWWTNVAANTSFHDHILPLFERLTANQWVNQGFLDRYGWQAPFDFADERLSRRIGIPPSNGNDPHAQLRRDIFYLFRQPGEDKDNEPPFRWPPIYGSASDDFSGNVGSLFTYTKTNLHYLSDWMNGAFVNDGAAPKEPHSLDEVAPEDRPDLLDRAALHWCMGGPFHPGCELTWIMRQRMLYRAPFRIKARRADAAGSDYGPFLTPALALSDDGPLSASGPGDLTKWMAVPWQTDTASCRAGYEPNVDPYLPTFWPAHVPNHVLASEAYEKIVKTDDPDKQIALFRGRKRFFRGIGGRPYLSQLQRMVTDFGKFGVLEPAPAPESPRNRFPATFFVETGFGFDEPPGLADDWNVFDAGVDLATRFGQRAGGYQ